MKTLMMICHYFRPDTAVGALRPLRFAQHLKDFGWRAEILTSDKGKTDEKISDDEFDVTRIKPCDENLLGIMTRPLYPESLRKKVQAGLLWRTRRYFSFPDPHTFVNRWYWPLVKEARRLIRSGNIDAVWVTSSPQTYLCIAERLARDAKVPVILDMRDEWTNNFLYEYKGLRNMIARRIEASAIHHAAAVTPITPLAAEKLRQRYPLDAAKITCIQNGFHDEDIPTAQPRNDGRFMVAMMGQSYENHAELFSAIRIARELDADFAHRFIFRWVGYQGDEKDISGVELFPRVPQCNALKMVAAADAFWLEVPVNGNTDIIICSKTYEYLAMRRPIIGTMPKKSCNADIVKKICNCRFISSRKPAEMAELLLESFNLWKEGRLVAEVSEDALNQFEATSLTLKLCSILDDITDTGG
ncbi:MAG TPA: glycosyltransferase [Phycisphaerae bacterium]|nr:glycosyltransferase [Phycisphaerae bacterium]